MPRSGPGDPPVYHVTDAATAHSDDQDARITRYLISMLIRTVCVALVFVVDGWLRWVFAAGAIGLPYVAVVVANNSGRRRGRPERPSAPPRTALHGRAATAAAGATDPAQLLTGVVHPRADDPAPASGPTSGATAGPASGAGPGPAPDPPPGSP